MVREAGAAEVHLRSASPPIMWPDFYGIDMPDREKLLAATHTVGAWGYIGVVPLATGLLGSCPLYSLLGISTRRSR